MVSYLGSNPGYVWKHSGWDKSSVSLWIGALILHDSYLRMNVWGPQRRWMSLIVETRWSLTDTALKKIFGSFHQRIWKSKLHSHQKGMKQNNNGRRVCWTSEEAEPVFKLKLAEFSHSPFKYGNTLDTKTPLCYCAYNEGVSVCVTNQLFQTLLVYVPWCRIVLSDLPTVSSCFLVGGTGEPRDCYTAPQLQSKSQQHTVAAVSSSTFFNLKFKGVGHFDHTDMWSVQYQVKFIWNISFIYSYTVIWWSSDGE